MILRSCSYCIYIELLSHQRGNFFIEKIVHEMTVSCISPSLHLRIVIVTFRATQRRRPPELFIGRLFVDDISTLFSKFEFEHSIFFIHFEARQVQLFELFKFFLQILHSLSYDRLVPRNIVFESIIIVSTSKNLSSATM